MDANWRPFFIIIPVTILSFAYSLAILSTTGCVTPVEL